MKEMLVLEMCEHATNWKVQREFILQDKDESVYDIDLGVQLTLSKDTLVSEYFQNWGCHTLVMSNQVRHIIFSSRNLNI